MEKNLNEKLYEELKRRGLYEEEDDDNDDDELDDDDEMDDSDDDDNDDTDDSVEEVGSNEDFCEMVCNILHSRNQAHVFHLQTQSFAEHKALNDYYEGVVGFFDGIVENRDSVEDSYLQNQIDTVQELINSTIYKLKFLK